MPKLEWPLGSGRIAYYSSDERAAVLALIADGEKAAIAKGQIIREVEVIHDLKVELDARLLPVAYQPPLEPPSFYRPPADSPFQIPEGVLRELAYDGPQRDPDE